MGLNSRDDAGVFQISPELALIQTVDYFAPVVDDPFDYGQIAVANSLSDIYAMGAKPMVGLNIVGFPTNTLSLDILKEILRGGLLKAREAGVTVLGGHSVKNPEISFGMAVTGIAHPDEIVKNNTARPGDLLILTKPIGTGILTTALKNEKLPAELLPVITEKMKQLNDRAAEVMKRFGATACTDVTGFGLLGHLFEMTDKTDVSAVLDPSKVPLLPGAEEFRQKGSIPGGLKNNAKYIRDKLSIHSPDTEKWLQLLSDPQTSGGLLIAIPPENADACLRELKKNGYPEAAVIGEFTAKKEAEIILK